MPLAYLEAIRALLERKAALFFCIDPDHLYRCHYIDEVQDHILRAGLDPTRDTFCLNLIHQEWTENADGVGSIIPFHFRGGLGLAPDEEQAGQRVGAPGTYVLSRPAAELLIAEVPNDQAAKSMNYDIVWRRALLRRGINIDLVETSKPVFVYVTGKQKEPAQLTALPCPAATTVIASANSSSPAVSIVIPTNNEAEWLRRTIESVSRALCRQSWEVVVVDDGCTDGSVELIRGWPNVRIVATPVPQSGAIVTRNLGAKAATGKYLCFIDSHILVLNGWLDFLHRTCEEAPGETMTTCNIFDVRQYGVPGANVDHQYGYSLSGWSLGVRWHLALDSMTQVILAGFAFAGVEMSAFNQTFVDANGDGNLDLMLHFSMNDELREALQAIYADLLQEDADDDDFSHKQLGTLSLGGTFGEHDQEFEGSESLDLLFSGAALRELLESLDL